MWLRKNRRARPCNHCESVRYVTPRNPPPSPLRLNLHVFLSRRGARRARPTPSPQNQPSAHPRNPQTNNISPSVRSLFSFGDYVSGARRQTLKRRPCPWMMSDLGVLLLVSAGPAARDLERVGTPLRRRVARSRVDWVRNEARELRPTVKRLSTEAGNNACRLKRLSSR